MLSDQPHDKRKQTSRSGRKRSRSNNRRTKTSEFVGVSRQGRRYEAFVWDTSVLKKPEKKGKTNATVYLGTFEKEEDAAKARDLLAIKIWGPSAYTNYPVSMYEKELLEMKDMSRDECVDAIKRKRDEEKARRMVSMGLSGYRGVYRNQADQSRWQARMGKGRSIRGLYLGTFDTEEEAARAYDIATIRLKGPITNINLNLDPQLYDIESIMKSSKIPIGKGASRFIAANTVNDILRHITTTTTTTNNSGEQSHLNFNLVNSNDDPNNEVRVSIGDDENMKLAAEGCSSEFLMLVEDDTESRWSEENGESLMDYLLSSGNGNDLFDDFEKGFDPMADVDWSFADD